MHGSVTMQGVGEEAEQREREATEQAAAAKAKKLQIAEKKEAEAAAASERDAAFARCELACVCMVTPCPYAKWKRCPACGPKSGLCKVKGVCGCTQATAARLHTSSRAVGGAQGGWGAVRTTWLFYEPREVVNAAHSRSPVYCGLCWWCKN